MFRRNETGQTVPAELSIDPVSLLLIAMNEDCKLTREKKERKNCESLLIRDRAGRSDWPNQTECDNERDGGSFKYLHMYLCTSPIEQGRPRRRNNDAGRSPSTAFPQTSRGLR